MMNINGREIKVSDLAEIGLAEVMKRAKQIGHEEARKEAACIEYNRGHAEGLEMGRQQGLAERDAVAALSKQARRRRKRR